MKRPVIAIIGRPNVGKSTLVNRIVGSRKAIVDDLPGVTRDRSYYDAEWTGKHFTLVDTGGLVPGPINPKDVDADGDKRFTQLINQQVEIALAEADAVVMVVDGQTGLLPDDEAVASQVRKASKQVFLVANKVDRQDQQDNIHEFYKLGFGEPLPLSAMHGSVGVGDLLDQIFAKIDMSDAEDADESIRMSILGRPNVGKSSILNAMVGEGRTIVSEISGTTRDAIDMAFDYEQQRFILVDTAGIRKKGKVDYGVELFAVDRSLRALKESDVSVVVLDATESLGNSIKEFVTDQDKKIIETSNTEGKALIVVVNKWDLIPEKTTTTTEEFKKTLFHLLPHARYAPVVFTSAKTGQRLPKILDLAKEIYGNWQRRHKTSLVNQVLLEAVMLSPPPVVKGRQLKVYYATQVSAGPPTFIVFVNDAKLMKENYRRYLEKKLRESFELAGTPVLIIPRSRGEKE